MNYCFGDIVVVEDYLIGVVVKSWADKTHEIYVRNYNSIKQYSEDDIQRYMVRHKYLDNEELRYQYNATNC